MIVNHHVTINTYEYVFPVQCHLSTLICKIQPYQFFRLYFNKKLECTLETNKDGGLLTYDANPFNNKINKGDVLNWNTGILTICYYEELYETRTFKE